MPKSVTGSNRGKVSNGLLLSLLVVVVVLELVLVVDDWVNLSFT